MTETTAPTAPARQGAATRRRRRWPWVLLAVVAALAAWGALATIALLDARAELELGRASAQGGATALAGGDVEAAERDLAAAEAAFTRAGERLRSPAARAATLLPVAGRNLRAVTALADAGALVAGGGREVTATVNALPGGVGAFAPTGGALPVGALEQVAPAVTAARQRVEQARALLAAAPAEGIVAQVVDARAQLGTQLDRVEDTLAATEPLLRALPRLLGAEGPRRYFFGAAQPAELRGSTGFIGAYAILTLDQGRFSFSPFGAIQDLPLTPPGVVPPPNPDFLRRYGQFGGTGDWQNLNVSPDFPTTGTAIERLWEHTYGERLDGTISADPFALAALLSVAGPTEVPGVGVVDAGSVVDFVSNEAYAIFDDPEQRKRLLGEVAAAALAGFVNTGLSGDASQGTLGALRALGQAAGEGHVLIHAADAEVQQALADAGVAGQLLDPPGGYLAAMVTGASGSKIDYYLSRELEYAVTLEPDGGASSRARLRLRNDAPTSGRPPYVIGPNTDRVVAGENEVYVSAYLASSAALAGVTVDGRPAQGRLESELGHPVVETYEELPAGAGRELAYDIVQPAAWTADGDAARFLLTIQEQAVIRPTVAALAVTCPEGMVVTQADEPWAVEDSLVRYSGELRGTFSAAVTCAPPARPGGLWEWLGERAVNFGG
jgi:hypothetical protein